MFMGNRGCLHNDQRRIVRQFTSYKTWIVCLTEFKDRKRQLSETARFRFLAESKEALGEQPYRFVHNPNTKAGWQVPWCWYVLKSAADAAVLAEMHLPDKTLPVNRSPTRDC
jgi:hypothetical protein